MKSFEKFWKPVKQKLNEIGQITIKTFKDHIMTSRFHIYSRDFRNLNVDIDLNYPMFLLSNRILGTKGKRKVLKKNQ